MFLICKIGRRSGELIDYSKEIGEMLLADGRAVLPTPEPTPILQPDEKPEPVKKTKKPAKRKSKSKKGKK